MPQFTVEKIYKPNILRGMLSYFVATIFFFFWILFTVIFSMDVVGIAFPLLLALIFTIVPYLRLRVQSYELRDDGVFVRKGVISKTQALVLYSQVQDVQESQSFLERILGIGNLNILTMSQQRPITLVALNKPEMNEIKNYVLSQASKSEKSIETLEAKEVSAKSQYRIHPVKKNISSLIIVAAIVLAALEYFSVSNVFNLGADISNLGDFGVLTNMFYLIAFLAIVIVIVGSYIQQISFRFRFADGSILIGNEFLSKSFINLPYEKIQDVGLSKGPLDRLLHMSNLVVETGEQTVVPSGKKSPVLLNHISGLSEKDANEIRGVALSSVGIKNFDTSDLRKKFPLQGIKPLKKSVSTTFWVFLIAGILTLIIYPLASWLGGIILRWLPVTLAAIFGIKLIYEVFYFRSYDYSDNEEIMVLRKGVFMVTEVTVPYEKIQNVFINRDIFDRVFGLYDVHLSTVGRVSQMELHIDGISMESSESLKNLLMGRISETSKE